MSINEAITNLKRIRDGVAIEKDYAVGLVKFGRLLMPEAQIREVRELLTEIGADVATAELYYNDFARMNPLGKRFASAGKIKITK